MRNVTSPYPFTVLSVANNSVHPRHSERTMLRRQNTLNTNAKWRVRAVFSIGASTTAFLGITWGMYYLILGKTYLAAIHLALPFVVAAQLLLFKSRDLHLEGKFVSVTLPIFCAVLCLFDTPFEGTPRSGPRLLHPARPRGIFHLAGAQRGAAISDPGSVHRSVHHLRIDEHRDYRPKHPASARGPAVWHMDQQDRGHDGTGRHVRRDADRPDQPKDAGKGSLPRPGPRRVLPSVPAAGGTIGSRGRGGGPFCGGRTRRAAPFRLPTSFHLPRQPG